MSKPGHPRVLIVEDDPDQYEVIAFALDAAGYEVEHARDGTEALAVLNRFRPHVLVTDLIMPGMSGDELIRRIREREGPRPRVVVISGLDRLRERCERLGADGCLGKPFDLDALLSAVASAARNAED